MYDLYAFAMDFEKKNEQKYLIHNHKSFINSLTNPAIIHDIDNYAKTLYFL